ncbi:MAG: NupC/NupG family nucleoside CNT transporter [Parabacteroides sp.]
MEWDGMSVIRGIVGVVVIVVIAYALSDNRKRIDWKLVGGGLLLQFLFALLVLYVPAFSGLLEMCGKVFVKLMHFTGSGLEFLLGPYASKKNGFSFLLHSLPIVVFFSALVSLLYHWGIIQRVVGVLSWILRKCMHISGTEGLVSSGNIFMGMTESPVLIKHYLPTMSRSEVFLVMVSGMATISGSVMGTYISLLGGTDPAGQILFAKHLLSASVMAVPGSIVISKLLCPQTEPVDKRSVRLQKESGNLLEAISRGTVTGVQLLTNIAAMLLVFISLIALANYLLCDLIGHYTGLNDWIVQWTDGRQQGLTFQFLLGVVTAPLVWLLGVPGPDVMWVGSLLGQKTILNEFVAYFQLQQWMEAGIFASQKSVIMSTYLLCGFANISSIGILLGGLGVLAPERRSLIASLGVRSMIGGALVSLLSATFIGLIIS